MSQPAVCEGQPGNWEEPDFFLRRLATVRFQMNGWQERYDGRLSRTVVCPAKAGMFNRSKSCQGNNQKPCSLDGRYEGNRLSEAHRQSCL
jgi:hypothetical protein